MAIPDHNNGQNSQELRDIRQPVSTLGDLVAFIKQLGLPDDEEATICSAIRRTDQLVGHGALDVAADAVAIMAKLDRLSPAMAAMSSGAFANLKSRVRKAFRLAKPRLAPAQSRRPLEPPWQLRQSQLATRERRSTSRFFHFASKQGWQPTEIADAHVGRFASYLREVALVADWDDDVRQTIRAWNKIASDNPGMSLAPLTQPEPKRTSYWIDPSQFPGCLEAEISKFLDEMANPPLFAAGRQRKKREGRRRPVRRKIKPRTVQQYRYVIISMVSALVASGIKLASITSLKDVVAGSNLNRSLTFMHRRAGSRTTPYMSNIAVRARRIAEWCGVPDAELGELDDLVAAVKEDLPRRRGMTAKNKALIERLDDPRFRDLVYCLSAILVERAQAHKNRRVAARIIRTAVAIEILMTCSVRRENLVTLELDKSIRKLGEGKNAFWIVEIAEADVKNEEPLRFQLPAESAGLLESYLSEWRPILCATPSSWLFPDAHGEMLDERLMTASVQKMTKRILGVPISTHQFRHVTAELYLRNNPEGLGTVSQHLGHRDINTTRTYYARPQQRQATRRYQERVILDRSDAVQRVGRRSRRKSKP